MTDTELFEFIDKIRALREHSNPKLVQENRQQQWEIANLRQAVSFSIQVFQGLEIPDVKRDTTLKMLDSLIRKSQQPAPTDS